MAHNLENITFFPHYRENIMLCCQWISKTMSNTIKCLRKQNDMEYSVIQHHLLFEVYDELRNELS